MHPKHHSHNLLRHHGGESSNASSGHGDVGIREELQATTSKKTRIIQNDTSNHFPSHHQHITLLDHEYPELCK